MGWSFDTIESWVQSALQNIGYEPSQAMLGASTVTWLQQRHAPGLAAMAQHIDFLSAYKLTPNHNANNGGDKSDARCPILLAELLQSQSLHNHAAIPAQTFQHVRQPLLLAPTLAHLHPSGGTLKWDEFETALSQKSLNIEFERKTLRAVLVSKIDVHWVPNIAEESKVSEVSGDTDFCAPSIRHEPLLTEILPRELVYVKTVQHYAGALPPREPLDGADTTDNASPSS